MSIRNHRWGISHESDLVWSHVCGMDPHHADRALMMIWHGYFDESDKDDWFVIAGYLARVDNWAAFSAEWAPMARKYGRVDRNGRWHFHMAERSRSDDMREDLPALRSIIADRVLMGLALALRPSDYRKAVKRLVGVKNGKPVPIRGQLLENVYLWAFEAFLDSLSHKASIGMPKLDQIDLASDRIDLIFDGRAEKKIIRNAWESFKRVREAMDIPNIINAEPRFEDDKEFMPLQAADFHAYWLRELLAELDDPAQIEGRSIFPFGKTSNKRVHSNVVVMTEEDIVARWTSLAGDHRVIDANKCVVSKLKA